MAESPNQRTVETRDLPPEVQQMLRTHGLLPAAGETLMLQGSLDSQKASETRAIPMAIPVLQEAQIMEETQQDVAVVLEHPQEFVELQNTVAALKTLVDRCRYYAIHDAYAEFEKAMQYIVAGEKGDY